MTGSSEFKSFAALVKELGWRKIKLLEKKHQIAFDYQRPRESASSLLGCLPLMLAPAFCTAAFYVYHLPEIGFMAATILGGMGLMLGITGVYMLFLTKTPDDRYILDLQRDELIEVKSKEKTVIRRVLCSIRDFDSLVLDAAYSFQKGSNGWRFGLVAISKAGSLMEFVPRRDERKREDVLKLGSALSELIDIPFAYGRENTIFEYKESPKGLQYDFVPFDPKAP